MRNRVNSEQHVPPSHLWDKIEQDAKSYDDENFDEAVRSKIKKAIADIRPISGRRIKAQVKSERRKYPPIDCIIEHLISNTIF